MTSIPAAQDFLDLLSGHAERGRTSSADRPNRLAKVDPAYVAGSFPGTLPRVTFEGESTLTVKGYNVAGSYAPQPGDRVLLVPVGNTYVILGKLAA